MKKIAIAVSIFAALSFPAASHAQWRTKEGASIPESDQVRSKDGFSAMLLMTSDPNWLKEWNKPPEHDPHFTTSHNVSLGKELNILTVLSNPKLDAKKLANVECDFSVQKPDGTFSIDQHALDCFKTKVPGNPQNLYMTAATLKFISESSDQKGEYKVQVTLHDKNSSGTSITLSDKFVNE
jgi:hypothetical protein